MAEKRSLEQEIIKIIAEELNVLESVVVPEAQILDHLAKDGFSPQISREEAIASLSAAIAPRKSGTFRRGQPGEWREHFTTENIARFKAATGDLLQHLGYETGSKW